LSKESREAKNMKKLFITTSILFALIVVGSLIASCAEGGLTTTITPSPGGTPITVTPTFTTTPPEIPHVYIIEEEGNPYISGLIAESGGAICFVCHGNIPSHSIWVDDPNICAECHIVSDNPVLEPR
jgi:hypothetical protein